MGLPFGLSDPSVFSTPISFSSFLIFFSAIARKSRSIAMSIWFVRTHFRFCIFPFNFLREEKKKEKLWKKL